MFNIKNSNKLPREGIKYFKNEVMCYEPTLPVNSVNAKIIISVNSNIDIIETKLIKTAKGVSNEGQRLSGYQILIYYKIYQILKYVGETTNQIVHAAELEPLSTCSIINVPEEINNIPIESIYHSNLFTIDSIVERIYIDILDERILLENIFVFLNIRFMKDLQNTVL